jgi:ferredoxin
MEEGYPRFLDDCRLCGECVKVCPTDAIIIKEEGTEIEFSDYKGILVFAEQWKGKVHPVSYELQERIKSSSSIIQNSRTLGTIPTPQSSMIW